jgi:CBS domain-containing protein
MMISIKDLLYTQNITEASENDSLSKALSKLPSSHSAAFIFSRDKKKVGLVNPYHCVIKSSLPGNAKVDACIFHPPKLYVNSQVEKIIESFISSKIHYLPIFNPDEKFAGVISARKLLDAYKDSPHFDTSIRSVLKQKHKKIVTIKDTDTIAAAVHIFKLHKISKLIVVNKDKKLKGILSYYDIVNLLLMPKQRPKIGDKENKKDSIQHQKVSKFAKSFVLTLHIDDLMSHALTMVLDNKIGSVVVIDKYMHPVGILTTRDFFSLILQPSIGLQLYLFTKNLSGTSNEVVQRFFRSLNAFVNKQKDLGKARLMVKEEKRGGVFKVFFSMLPKHGKEEIIKREGKNLKEILKEVKDDARSLHSKKQKLNKH